MSSRTHLYVGSYTHESAIGIHVYDASDPSGALIETSTVEGLDHPSFLAAHPSGGTLYAVSETSPDGGLVALRIDADDGSLSVIDHTSSHGGAPCHVSVAADGRHVYVANYLGGNVAVYELTIQGRFGDLVAVRQHHGSGPTDRQEGPHAHCITPDKVDSAVYAVDLGTDSVYQYAHISGSGGETFELVDQRIVRAGAGPRHLAFHPDEPVAFLVGELDSTVLVLDVEPTTGRLSVRQTMSTVPDGFTGASIGAEVRVHPSGRVVYVSNRGHDSIAVFGFHGADVPLEALGHVPTGGRAPRNFAVHPSARSLLVANQNSNTLIPFELDADGHPHQLDVAYDVSEPVCVTFLEVAR